jgi:hypothetical protein
MEYVKNEEFRWFTYLPVYSLSAHAEESNNDDSIIINLGSKVSESTINKVQKYRNKFKPIFSKKDIEE